jgi:hypothetical protein
VKKIDVDDDGTEQSEAKWHKAAQEKERAADDLQRGDGCQIAGGIHRADKFPRVASHGRHREEVEECIGTEDNENQSEKNAGDNGNDFHVADRGLIEREFQSRSCETGLAKAIAVSYDAARYD